MDCPEDSDDETDDSSTQAQEDFREKLEETLVSCISNIKSPSGYNPNELNIDVSTIVIAQAGVDIFLLSYLEQTEYDHLSAYEERIKKALEAYEKEEPYACIFISLSVQDGAMTWVCENSSEVEPNEKGNYSIDDKRRVLAQRYRERFEELPEEETIETGDFIGSLEPFYEHRNAIMHGDPIAYFNMELATISLLFLQLTFEAIYSMVDDAESVNLNWERIMREE